MYKFSSNTLRSLQSRVHYLLGIVLLASLMCHSAFGKNTESALIAVASNFAGPMRALVKDFEQKHAHRIHISIGSTGKITAQIKHGAPYDAFFSADQVRPSLLVQQGYAVPASQTTYASGRLVLWSAQSSLTLNASTLRALLQQSPPPRMAIANPKLAPYGSAAMETLHALNFSEGSQLVYGENINQTFQFAASGNAHLGWIALSQVMQHGKIEKGSYWIIPPEMHTPILQDAVVLIRGKDKKAIIDFMKYLTTPSAQRIISSFGYAPLPSVKGPEE